ncbi:MAG: glutamine--fructose-6-phosphate transaminase (isomerizing), partial [Armatimonadota bacterium]
MCGIVGFIGNRGCASTLIDQLIKLEYRGYDSAGVAIVDGGSPSITRSVGKIRELKSILDTYTPSGTLGIAHTRWATHGAPS